jgi:hypothetical protein
VTVFTSPVDSTGIPDVRFEETGGGELDSDGGLGTFPFHLFKDNKKIEEARKFRYGVYQAGKLLTHWTALVLNGRLFVSIPEGPVPHGGKECFIRLLDYAEEELKCQQVYVCCEKERPDRADVLRTFAFLGFTVVPPTLSPVDNPELVLMGMPLD